MYGQAKGGATVRALKIACLIAATCLLLLAGAGSASADPPECPRSNELATLAELEEVVLEAGGEIGEQLTSFFEFVDENDDGLICYKLLPEATPFPTPPFLAGDNRR
jgi:hypothetical protein